MTGRVSGKVALVTGAGRGQGRSHAVRLAEEGASIIAVDICADMPGVEISLATEADLAETAKLVEEAGSKVVTAVADVRDFGQIKDAVAQGLSAYGGIDIVAAIAGVTSFYQTDDIPEEAWDAVVDTNLKGVCQTCKAVLPSMIEAGRAARSASRAHRRAAGDPQPGPLHRGQDRADRAHAHDGAGGGPALHPGQHGAPDHGDSPMVQNDTVYKVFNEDPALQNRQSVEGSMAAFNLLPIPWIEPRDVSNLILFLASDEARYITGAHIPGDAGCAETVPWG